MRSALRRNAPGDPNDHDPRLVVQVVPYFPPHIGGMEKVAESIAQRLAEHRRVEVLTSRSGRPAGAMPSAGVERLGNLVVRRLPTLELAHLPFMPTLLPRLIRVPRDAVVHVHVAQAYVPEMVWLSSLLRRRPFVAHFHLDCDPSGRLGALFVAYKRWILPRVLRSAARVIALSPDQAEFLRERYGVRKERIVILPNAVGGEFFREPLPAPSHGGAFRLLFVGRLSPQKNVSRLLRAIALVTRPVELVIVGEGEQRETLERLCAELKLGNVRMVGGKAGEELARWYRWADAFVLTSDKEGMPLVLLEAMAGGLPIVATRVPGVADTIGPDGLLAAPDPAAIAEAVDRLAADPGLWADLAHRSYRRGTRLGWTSLITTLQRVYEDVAA